MTLEVSTLDTVLSSVCCGPPVGTMNSADDFSSIQNGQIDSSFSAVLENFARLRLC